MSFFLVQQASCLKGEISLPGDKSIAQRCIIISAICPAKTIIENFPANKDCLNTIKAFKKLGIKITLEYCRNYGLAKVTVFGKGPFGLKNPSGPIFVGDSGTTLRLILGILAGQKFKVRLITGKSLKQRPMLRVNMPLRMMGAIIKSKIKNQISNIEEYPPITIQGGNLKAITYKMPVASAQVKSAVLLAGLYAKGITRVKEPFPSRDHTERLLKLFKADIKVEQNEIVVEGNRKLVSPGIIYIPGDISSAGFFIGLAAILPNAQILIRKVSLNPSRLGLVKVLRRMGAFIKIQNQKSKIQNYEPMGDILIKSSFLRGTTVKKEEVPSLIDELPILMVAACVARGKTTFEAVGELRLKETDRINSMWKNLSRMGAIIQVQKTARSEDIVIHGVKELSGSQVRSFGDHRTAMSMVVAGLAAKGKTRIDDISCIDKSFPDFLAILKRLLR